MGNERLTVRNKAPLLLEINSAFSKYTNKNARCIVQIDIGL
jgi:hypothetical protein